MLFKERKHYDDIITDYLLGQPTSITTRFLSWCRSTWGLAFENFAVNRDIKRRHTTRLSVRLGCIFPQIRADRLSGFISRIISLLTPDCFNMGSDIKHVFDELGVHNGSWFRVFIERFLVHEHLPLWWKKLATSRAIHTIHNSTRQVTNKSNIVAGQSPRVIPEYVQHDDLHVKYVVDVLMSGLTDTGFGLTP